LTVGTAAPSGNLYYLHNSTGGNAFSGTSSTAASTSPMMFSTYLTPPTASSLVPYSTDDGQGNSGNGNGNGQPGRYLNPVGASPSFTDTTPLDVSNWWYKASNSDGTGTYNGTTYLTVWAEPSASGGTVSLRAMVGYKSNGNSSSWVNETTSAATVTGSGCDSWRQFIIAIPTNTFSVGNNDKIEVELFNNSATGERIAYDTTTYNANVVWTRH